MYINVYGSVYPSKNMNAVGKWHLGPNQQSYHPRNRGFDHYYGHPGGFILMGALEMPVATSRTHWID